MQGQHLFISGRVQGVGFRQYTLLQAEEMHLRGWVRNRSDGRVEVLVGGPDQAVRTFVDLLRTGPRWAAVERIESLELEDEQIASLQRLTTFEVRGDGDEPC